MSLIRHVWDNVISSRGLGFLLAFSAALSFAEGVVEKRSSDSRSAESVLAAFDSSGASNSALVPPPSIASPNTALSKATTDSAKIDSLKTAAGKIIADSAASTDSLNLLALQAATNVDAKTDIVDSSLKSVLYLSGGENSPWFYLGVLYAIEEYHIPVDSIVGTSWGAWVGAMWSKGMRLDDMQRLFLESDFEPFVGRDNIEAKTKSDPYQLPLSLDGIPSLRYRFALRQDSSGIPHRIFRQLIPDTAGIERSLAHLRFQESLYRQSIKYKIPFRVLKCDGELGESNEDVVHSLPLVGNSKSGEVCPYFALPAEDVVNEFPIIVIADPVRAEISGDPWQKALKQRAAIGLNNQPGVIVRAHTILDSSHKALIQAGFSAMETRMNKLSYLQNRKMSYESMKREVYPWFRYNPTFDSLSAEKHASAKSFWNELDTGVVAPRNFAYAMMQNPVYDSLTLDMQPNGDLVVGAKSSPMFDVAAGGFGSNAFGPNAYAEVDVRFINQMEFGLVFSGFWGGNSYGFLPSFSIDKLWMKNWSVSFAYEWVNLRPLKSFNNSIPSEKRIYSEQKNDVTISVDYAFSDFQKIGLGFVLGNQKFELDTLAYYDHYFSTYPVSPNVHYSLTSGEKEKWFATEGYDVSANLGLQSIGFELGKTDMIPIYLKAMLDMHYTVSPSEHLTFTVGASGGFEQFHEEGMGYVYPKDFEYAVLSDCYRMHPEATPWGNEWFNSALASHHFGLLRMNGALHYKGNGLWLFGAFVRDFEDNPNVELGVNKIVLEPALRLKYKSFSVYAGVTQTVDIETVSNLKSLDDYEYFIRIGDYSF